MPLSTPRERYQATLPWCPRIRRLFDPMAPSYGKTRVGGSSVANPDDVVPDLPALPPGSEFSYLEGRLQEIFAPMNDA